MIKHKIEYQQEVNIQYFAENIKICKGKVLGQASDNPSHVEYNIADLAQNCNNAIGISLCDVVNLNLMKQHINFHREDVQSGSKIIIMSAGKLRYHFNKDLKLPLFQPIYVDMKTSELTWRFRGIQVGRVIIPQDKAGWCVLEVKF